MLKQSTEGVSTTMPSLHVAIFSTFRQQLELVFPSQNQLFPYPISAKLPLDRHAKATIETKHSACCCGIRAGIGLAGPEQMQYYCVFFSLRYNLNPCQ